MRPRGGQEVENATQSSEASPATAKEATNHDDQEEEKTGGALQTENAAQGE